MTMFYVTCGIRKICLTIKKLQIIFLFLICILTALVVKNSHIFAIILFAPLEKHPSLNFKGLQYQIWISVKRLGT